MNKFTQNDANELILDRKVTNITIKEVDGKTFIEMIFDNVLTFSLEFYTSDYCLP